jgi:hypothetical protein
MKLRVWIALLAVAALPGCGRRPRSALPLEDCLLSKGYLAGHVVKVELDIRDVSGQGRKVVLEKPEQIRALLSCGTLVKEPPCRCAHLEMVTFHGKQGNVTASICEHCFDILNGNKVDCFSMPPGFYALFQEHMGLPHAADAPGAER